MKYILALFVFLISFQAGADEWTLHTYTKHVLVPGAMNDKTFGLGYIKQSKNSFGFTVGVIPKNSFNVTSVYGAGVTPWMLENFRAGVGLISGYSFSEAKITGKRKSIIPLVSIEYRVTDQIGVVWTMQAFNLAFHW